MSIADKQLHTMTDEMLMLELAWQVKHYGKQDPMFLFELDRRDDYTPSPPATAATLLGSALWYVSQGIAVFPLRAGRKTPATANGFKSASLNPTQVRAWWGTNPNYNIGLPTGILFDVCDLDSKEAADRWFTADQRPPLVGLVKTPRGWHYWTPATGTKNAVDVEHKTDWRGIGGYVVAPPSRLTDGGQYWWWLPPQLGDAK